MKIKLILSLVLFTCAMSINVSSQENKPQSVEDYINTGKTIVIARCISTEPVMRSGDTYSKVQILRVVKGKETTREIEVVVTKFFSLKEGVTYLLRTENEANPDKVYFRIKSLESMVEFPPYEKVEALKNLSVKTIVERVIWMRKNNLDNEIRRLTDERNGLEKMFKEEENK